MSAQGVRRARRTRWPGERGTAVAARSRRVISGCRASASLRCGLQSIPGRLAHLGDERIRILGKTSATSSGSVFSSENTWSIILNDSWILGGVHAHVNLELVSPVQGNVMERNYTKDVAADRKFPITGRELSGLKILCCQQVYGSDEKISHDARPADLPGSNILLQCTNPALADAATLTRYTNEVNRMAASKDATTATGRRMLDDMFV